MQGITDRRQLLDLTDRACTKRYILYMHKMNKRENVRAAVDLHCLGLTYPQLIAANAAQSSAAPESELSHEAAAFAAAMSSLPPEPCQIHGPEAAGHLVPGTLAGQQVSAEAAPLRHVRESPSETASTRRSARLRSALGAAEEVAEIGQSPSAGTSQSSAAYADCNCPALNLLAGSSICRPPSREFTLCCMLLQSQQLVFLNASAYSHGLICVNNKVMWLHLSNEHHKLLLPNDRA